jgi:hypothetical protein
MNFLPIVNRAGGSRTLQDFLVTGAGIVTSVATALILALMESWGFALYSLTVWFVVPVGAILAGFGAASGYYFGARLFHHRPTRLVLFNVISVAISTYFLINYLNYSWLQIDGQQVSDAIPFSQYLDIVLSNQSMEFRIRGAKLGETGNMGGWGVVMAALQVLGFAAGGLGLYRYLRSLPYCSGCAKYFSKESTDKSFVNESNDDWKNVYVGIARELEHGNPQAARNLLIRFGSSEAEKNPKLKKNSKLNIQLTLWKCATCPQEFAETSVNQRDGRNWQAVQELQIRGYIQSLPG